MVIHHTAKESIHRFGKSVVRERSLQKRHALQFVCRGGCRGRRHEATTKAVAYQMNPLHVIRQPIKQWCYTYLSDCSGALFHFVVSQIVQKSDRAGFDSRKNITQSSCAACRGTCPMRAKRRGAASTSAAGSNQRG